MRPPESFIGQPIRSLQTMLRVLAEDNPQYESIIPDGIYGPDTIRAVSAFQRNHGLPVTGITDQITWENVVSQYNPAIIRRAEAHPLHIVLNPGQVIRKGEKHPHIFLIQSMLKVISEVYESISEPSYNGILDEATAESISSFQYLSGLPSSGHLDKITWKHIALQYPLAAEQYQRMDK